MPYYDTIEEDLKRAKEILAHGKHENMPHGHRGGTIYGADNNAAYLLLESFVQEIERLHKDAASFNAQLDAIVTVNDELQAAVDGDNCSPAVLRAIELLDFAIHGK